MASNSWKRILNSLFGNHNQSRNSKRRLKVQSSKLQLEALEDRLVPSGASPQATISTLASITDSNGNGLTPNGGLVADSSGNLYGTTSNTTANSGTVFEIMKGSGTANILYTFSGATPSGSVVLDGKGDVFGTTGNGGTGNKGSVFELTPDANSPTGYDLNTLASFTGTSGALVGNDPSGNLVMDGNGNIFGTTITGGSGNFGTVFELSLNNGSYTPTSLGAFTKLNGAGPTGSLVLDSNDDVFGTTKLGGSGNQGAVFEAVKGNNNTYTLNALASFGTVVINGQNVSTGSQPLSGLVADGNGNLYGTTTTGGGANNSGTVFELAKNGSSYSSTITPLVSFGSGISPTGGLIYDSTSGTLYGVSSNSTGNSGTIFGLALGSSPLTLSTIYTFSGTTPLGGLAEDSIGNFYGATTNGGTNSGGTVYELTRAAPALSVTDAGGTYNGSTFPASATVNGGSSSEGVTPTLSYYVGTYSSAAQLSGLTALSGAPTYPGSYTVLASFAGSTDYSPATAVANFTINPPATNITTYDSQHRVTQVVYTNGNVFTRTYNSDGTSTGTLFNTSGTVGGGVSTDNYTYNAQGQVLTVGVNYTNGNVFTLTYNYSNGTLTGSSATLYNGSTLLDDYTYSASGQLTAYHTYSANGNVYYRTYNADGTSQATVTNSSGTVAPGVNTFGYTYNAAGQIATQTVNYTNGQVFARTYNYSGSTLTGSTATLSDSSNNPIYTYNYNAQGQVTSLVYASNGNTLTYSYDNSTGVLLSATLSSSDNTPIQTYTYTQGQLSSITYASNNNVLNLTYTNGVLSSATLMNGTNTIQAYTYNAGQIATITFYVNNSPGNVLTFNYSGGVLQTATLSNGSTTLQTYNYNAQGQVTTIDQGSTTTPLYTYTYDAQGRVSTVLFNSNNTTLTYSYTGNGSAGTATLTDSSNATLYTETLDVYGRATQIVYDTNGSPNGNVYNRTYKADGTSYATLANGSTTLDYYEYDAQGNLTYGPSPTQPSPWPPT